MAENGNYWEELGDIKLKIFVGLVNCQNWAIEFNLESSGFEFFIKKELTERIQWVENEVRKRVEIKQRLIENGIDFYRFAVTVKIGEQAETVEYDILKTTYSRLYPNQRIELAEIYGMSLVEWDFEVKNDD